MEEAREFEAAMAAVRAIPRRFATASDAELLADGAAIEALGRLVDALRVGFAGEAEHRSAKVLGGRRLSFREGARDGVELVQVTARIGHREARQRVALGAALAPELTISGQVVPGRHPEVAEAVNAGRIGVEAARVIVAAVNEVAPRADAEALATMIRSSIQVAETADLPTVSRSVFDWAQVVDPDGPEPKERAQRRKRALKIGKTLADGTTSLSMVLTPEDLAFMRELLASRRRAVCLVRTEPGGADDPNLDGPEWRPEGDDRPRVQQDYDTAIDTLKAGATATVTAPPLQETVVTITAAEVEARAGQGFLPGILAGIPIPVIERRACTGGVRLLVVGEHGEPLHLSRSQRLFSPAQKKALTVAAGGRCQYPGCHIPHPYLEAHHVEWHARDGGTTDIGNGIMLCSYHHHFIHAKDGPVRIVRWRGEFWVVPDSWTGPPEPRHRAQGGYRPAA